jgi:hypothetical protein
MFSLAQALKTFDDDGTLADRELHRRLDQTLVVFMDLVEASKQLSLCQAGLGGVPLRKPDPAVDRVDP